VVKPTFTESVVEDAALAWLRELGYTIRLGPKIALGEIVGGRDTLLPKLISGEIRIKDAEKQIAETA